MLGMYERQHLEVMLAGQVQIRPSYDRREALAVPKSLLWRATALAIESAFRFGEDLPVGASIGNGKQQIAGFFASDKRTGYEELHAERYALIRARAYGFEPVSLGVNMEPCGTCRPAIEREGVQNCYFILSREQLSERGLVNERPGLLDGPEQSEAPYYMQIIDPVLTDINLALIDSVARDRATGNVEVDREHLVSVLCDFAEITPFQT